MSFDDDDSVETTLIVLKQCFVYKIPPRATAAGYKANEWDLEHYMWTGRCVVTSEKENCKVKLEDPNTGDLFAVCNVTTSSIEPVSDSSRYFVIKIEDGSGRRAFIGMGFTERNDAFDFSAAIQDHHKFVRQNKEAAEAAKKAANQPKVDYSLPQGAKIHVELKGKKPSSGSSSPSMSNASLTGGLLPPPPGSRKPASSAPASGSPAMSSFGGSGGFDDFFGAPSSPSTNQFQQQSGFQQSGFQQSGFQQQQTGFQQQQSQNQFQQSGFQQQQFQQPMQQGFSQGFSQFNSPQQNQGDFWGDFTGSSNSQSSKPQQNNGNLW